MIRTATPDDAFRLTLRPQDAAEVSEGWREQVASAIARAPWCSLALEVDGEVLALGGADVGDQEVGVWLLCAEGVRRHGRLMLRQARAVLAYLRNRRGAQLVFNYVPKGSPNRAFVEHLGFRILPSPRDGYDFFYLPSHV